MAQSVKLALGDLAKSSYLTVKNLDPGSGSFTVKTSTLGKSITLPIGDNLVAFLQGGKVVSKVVPVTDKDTGKDALSISVDLDAYLSARQPLPEDVSGLTAELARVKSDLLSLASRVKALEDAPAPTPGQGGGGVDAEAVRKIISEQFLVLGPSDLIPEGTKPGTVIIRETA